MALSESLNKSFASAMFALTGIPEGKPILDKYFHIFWEAKEQRKDVIRQEYRRPEDKIEMGYALGVKSRVFLPLSLQTALIAMANGVSGQELIDYVTDPLFAYGEATIGDDFHDDVLRPKYLDEQRIDTLDVANIREMIRNKDRLTTIAKSIEPFVIPDKQIGPITLTVKTIYPLPLLNAANKQADIFKRRMSDSPRAYESYWTARDNLYGVQALSLLLSTALARRDIPVIREVLGKGEGGYVQSTIRLGNKLADIGKENAGVVFERTQPKTMDEKIAEETKGNLKLFSHGVTLLKQFTEDDSRRYKRDIKNNADNLWVLLSLQDQNEISEGAIGRYLEGNKQITRRVLIPPLEEMKEAYEGFEKLKCVVEEAGWFIGLITRQAEKDFDKFEKERGVRLDETWKDKTRELREIVATTVV